MADIGNMIASGAGTPLGDIAKRGILRPSGTPGSGNGGTSPWLRMLSDQSTDSSPLLPQEPLSSDHTQQFHVPTPRFTRFQSSRR